MAMTKPYMATEQDVNHYCYSQSRAIHHCYSHWLGPTTTTCI